MPDDTENAHGRAQRRYAQRFKDAGVVQVAVWVPEEHRAALLRLAALLRDIPGLPFPKHVLTSGGFCAVNVFECGPDDLADMGIVPPKVPPKRRPHLRTVRNR
jgi:hypothetical protein